MGYWTSHYLVNDGAKLIGVSERDGSIFNPHGIDPEALKAHKKQTGGVKDFPGAEYSPNENIIYGAW